jgi:hypothetical protein
MKRHQAVPFFILKNKLLASDGVWHTFGFFNLSILLLVIASGFELWYNLSILLLVIASGFAKRTV